MNTEKPKPMTVIDAINYLEQSSIVFLPWEDWDLIVKMMRVPFQLDEATEKRVAYIIDAIVRRTSADRIQAQQRKEAREKASARNT